MDLPRFVNRGEEGEGVIEVMLPCWIYRRICDLLVAVQPGKGWAFAQEQARNSAGVVQNALTKIRVIHERLKTVEIDHPDFRRRIENRDAPTTFLFLDPPYLMDLFGLETG
jgi:hypothetical protein